MLLNLTKELAALRKMNVAQLREKYAEVFGEGTNTRNRPWLVKRIVWRMQMLAEGDLSERARRRANELARDADLRLRPPVANGSIGEAVERIASETLPLRSDDRLPPSGTVLTRRYRGEDVHVRVLDDGFECDGSTYRSLSAVAKAITGSHCNGFHFFREALNGNGGTR